MHKEGDEIHIDDTEASAGANDGHAHVRWILAIGLLIAIVALSLIWITGAATTNPEEERPARTQGAAAETG